MQALDVDASNKTLLSARRSEEDVWWQQAEQHRQSRHRHKTWLLAVTALTGLGLLLALTALGLSVNNTRHEGSKAAWDTHSGAGAAPSWGHISRIAFSSCTSYDVRPQPIWTQGVISSKPDAWVWLGDFAYMDDPLVNCDLVPSFPECNCTADFMRRPPFQCFAGVVEHARLRVQLQLSIKEYQAFLSYMCPGYSASGVFPPWGTDPSMCPRPIFGVYDDHDSGWNNGNARNPSKDIIKNVYLDGIGEVPDSPRRTSSNGLQASYTLPGPGTARRNGLRDEVQLVLLDQRYFRDTLPCSSREAWCRRVLQRPSASAGDVAWCEDFLGDGSPGKLGSCCRKDHEWDNWCGKAANSRHPRWRELCDPTSAGFAQTPLILDTDNSTVLEVTDGLWDNDQPQLWHRLLEGVSSPLCEVLGLQQRRWLQEQLQGSKAALNIVACGSVLAGSIGWIDAENNTCSGDDLACWPRAQVNLLHTLANTSGCTVVLTGDYHYSDLKVIQPGGGHGYSEALQTNRLSKPVYQAMASGMTYSTAEHKVSACQNSYREDLAGLRPGGPCSYVPQPAFGMLEVDWEARVVSLSVRNHTTGGIAAGYDGSKQQLRFDLDTCRLL